MKRILAIFAMIFMAFNMTGCTKVPAGNVGVLFNLYGSDKGVDLKVVGPGKYWLSWNEELYLYPTFTQNYTWTQGESLSFQSVEGMVVNADVGISYALDQSKIPQIFQKYRKGVDEITDIYIRNMVRDALVTASSQMTVEDIYGPKRSVLIDTVAETVKKQVDPIGIKVEKIYWIGSIRLPKEMQAGIDAKLRATQLAQQRENELATATAEAAKKVAEAKGNAESTLLNAQAEAESIRIKANALRSNPELVELVKAEAQKAAVEKWNGELPSTMVPGSAVPFINVK